MAKDNSGLTPMMKQYFTVKAQHPEALLLFRCGDFYETYGDDAVLASKILGLVLTRRSNSSPDSVPMAGFPFHSLDSYLPRLVRAGYKVAVCDQLEDPKLTKNIVKRGVTEVVTPGVAFNEQLLDQKENNFIAGLSFDADKCGAAFLDVSTGTFQVAEGKLDYVLNLLDSFKPKELLVPRGYEKGIREKTGDRYYISTLEEWAFVYDNSVEKLKKQLKVDSLKGFAIDNFALGVTSAGALLIYLEQTQHAGLGNICSISRIDGDRYVWMDQFTFRNLEIFSASSGKDGVSLVDVMDRTVSPMGSRLLRNWMALPIMDLEELRERQDVVEWFVSHTDKLDALRELVGDIGDLERGVSRASAGKLLPRGVLMVKRGLSQLGPVKQLCESSDSDAVRKLSGAICECRELLDDIEKTIDPDTASMLGKGDVIAPGVSEELDELRRIARHGKDYLLEIQRRETERTGISSLKVNYNSVFGYYLEVRNVHKDKVPEDWVRKQTLVNAERYVTKELKEYEEKILGAEERIYVLETQIFNNLVAKIREKVAVIQNNCRAIAKIDVLAGFARIAIDRNYCRPQINDGKSLDIVSGRHPVIETMMGPGEEYVPNTVHLDSDSQQIIILTGPNMAGKSALLRQTALIVLLAQTGSFVPAEKVVMGRFDKIFTRVGASDNISRGESTFMVEMLETAMILHNISARSLVLLDEIGRGTSTYDGMSIARAIVEYIHENGQGAKTLFATHYHELNDMEQTFARVKNFHIAVKEVGKQVIFLRKMVEGGVAHSFGLHVARMAGMPSQVIVSAEKTLAALESGEGKSGAAKFSAAKQIKPHNVKEGRVEGDGSLQLSFFQLEDPLLSSLKDDLEAVDLNSITPLQAFDLLRKMKEKMGLNKLD